MIEEGLKMSNKKRGVYRNKGFYFKGNRIVLESLMSKVAFFGILFLFGVVIVFGVMDIRDRFAHLYKEIFNWPRYKRYLN